MSRGFSARAFSNSAFQCLRVTPAGGNGGGVGSGVAGALPVRPGFHTGLQRLAPRPTRETEEVKHARRKLPARPIADLPIKRDPAILLPTPVLDAATTDKVVQALADGALERQQRTNDLVIDMLLSQQQQFAELIEEPIRHEIKRMIENIARSIQTELA
jgi:hypothetical protein